MVNRCAWSDQRFDCYIFLVSIWNLHSICYQRELIIVILFLSKLRSSEVACFKPNVMGGGSSLQFCCRGKVDWRCVTTQSSCVATLPFSLVFRVLRLEGGLWVQIRISSAEGPSLIGWSVNHTQSLGWWLQTLAVPAEPNWVQSRFGRPRKGEVRWVKGGGYDLHFWRWWWPPGQSLDFGLMYKRFTSSRATRNRTPVAHHWWLGTLPLS